MTFASAASEGFPFDNGSYDSNDFNALVLDHDRDRDRDPEPRNPPLATNQQRSSIDSNLLSPFLSRVDSDSLSPSVNHFETPADSASTLSHYQSSDFSDLDEDLFFGTNFSNAEVGTPSFLDDQSVWDLNDAGYNVDNGAPYPLTPERTSSTHPASPRSGQRVSRTRLGPDRTHDSISPRELQKPFGLTPLAIPASQLTPSQSGSGRSSEDGLAPPPVDMRCPSPRVTVSVWDKDEGGPVHTVERTFEESPSTVRGGIESAGDLIFSTGHEQGHAPAHRDSMGQWRRDPATGLAGLDPKRRPGGETASVNEIVSRKEIEERNRDVGRWLSSNLDDPNVPPDKTPEEEIKTIEEGTRNSNDDIPLGDNTENRYIPGQTYYYPSNGGQMTDEDFAIIYSNRNWADAPVLHSIKSGTPGRDQPQTSQAAIERFERMCRDNDSIISRAATWGTRRRSLPSVIDLDIEGVTSGSFLKKLSISRGGDRSHKPSNIFKELRGLVRRPSVTQMRKRSRSGQGEALLPQEELPQCRHDSTPHLSPTSRTSSWGRKPTPSINTALVSMGQNFASIGTAHSRCGSVSGAPVATAKGPLSGLSVKNTLRRPRSKSDLPKPTSNTETQSSLVEMWKKSGGPPVASLGTAHAEVDDDEDEDDDFYEDNDLKMNPNIIDDITPNLAGFEQHINTLNPALPPAHSYLVDRMAHQQIVRYKQLLTTKVKHLGLGTNCPCGSLCLALGGSANLLDSKGDARGMDPLSTRYEDLDTTPTEGVINQDSFPADIPMPPTQHLPAEFECQLCYQKKKFQKPSDWTKHVHEDVQPFTCTWDRCRDPKMFKRKADWVRHENEGHRHLEWWTCDVEDCRHTCYRRDNFLQHLVREHKFQEPKYKTKAAMKKAGNADPTWRKVEQCHAETEQQPQEEPCRFCGKAFPTWKKLTVHLAKHMEQISLPVLRLVAAKAKELTPDTIISPVQDRPSRREILLPGDPKSPALRYPDDARQSVLSVPQQVTYHQNQGQFIHPVMTPGQFQPTFYSPQFDNIGQNLQQQPSMGTGQLNQGYDLDGRVRDLPIMSAPYAQGPNSYMAIPPNEMPLNALGLQNVASPAVGGQIGYDGIMDASSGNGSPSGHEALSTYSHSPHPGASNSDNVWDDRQLSGFEAWK